MLKKLLAVVAWGIFHLSTLAANSTSDQLNPRAQVVFTFNAAEETQFIFNNKNGDFTVERGEVEEPNLILGNYGDVPVDYNITIQDNDKLYVKIKYPEQGCNQTQTFSKGNCVINTVNYAQSMGEINIKLVVPPHWSPTLSIKNRNGNTVISYAAFAEINTVNGTINVSGSKEVNAKTVNGHIILDGNIKSSATTVNGSITVINQNSANTKVKTVNGFVKGMPYHGQNNSESTSESTIVVNGRVLDPNSIEGRRAQDQVMKITMDALKRSFNL